MIKENSLIISKLDSARRQLEIAIRLYFSDEDPISIHTLTAASYNVINDINKKSGMTPMFIKEQLLQNIQEDKRSEVRMLINKAENFFKHADKDQNESIEFNPEISELLIWDACAHYSRLTNENPPLFKLFNSWFIIQHTNIFNHENDDVKKILDLSDTYKSYSKSKYYFTMLPIIFKIQ